MLEGLGAVPWDKLKHAFGSAKDVPDQLRKLAGDPAQQEEAFAELYCNIWHQGTVYEASAYAVPFLVELAASADVGRRADILELIGALAWGSSYPVEHGPMVEERRADPDISHLLEAKRGDVALVRDAVLRAAPVFLELLRDPDPQVRAAAAHPLAAFPQHQAEIIEAAQIEPDPQTQAVMLGALGLQAHVSVEGQRLLRETVERSADVVPKLAAALVLLKLDGTPHPAAAQLYRFMAAAERFTEIFSRELHRLVDEDVLELFADVKPDPEGAITFLSAYLDRPGLPTHLVSAITGDLLRLAFPEGGWRKTKRWSAAQKQIVERVLKTTAVLSNPFLGETDQTVRGQLRARLNS